MIRKRAHGNSKTEYANVYEYTVSYHGKPARTRYCYNKVVCGVHIQCSGFKEARTAAVALDKKLIDMGKEPVNVFRRQTPVANQI